MTWIDSSGLSGYQSWWKTKRGKPRKEDFKAWPLKVRSCTMSIPVLWMPLLILRFDLDDTSTDGYPRLATLLDSDEHLMQYRRFGFLQTRLLLYKQDELRTLEKELDAMDKNDEQERDHVLFSRVLDDRESGMRNLWWHKSKKSFTHMVSMVHQVCHDWLILIASWHVFWQFLETWHPLIRHSPGIISISSDISTKPSRFVSMKVTYTTRKI